MAALPVVVVVLLLGALFYVESDRGRAMIVSTAQEQGINLHYEQLVLSPFSGVFRLEGLRIAMPEPHSQWAQDLMHIGRIELRWSTLSLLALRLYIEKAEIDHARFHLVMDEDGRSSLDLLAGEPSKDTPAETITESKAVPLSHTLSAIVLPLRTRLENFSLSDVRAELTKNLADGQQSLLFEGLELEISAAQDGAPLAIQVDLSSPNGTGKTLLQITDKKGEHSETRLLELQHAFQLHVDGAGQVSLLATAELLRQTFEEQLNLPSNILTLRSKVEFSPEKKSTRVEVEQLELLGGLLQASLATVQRDDEIFPRPESGQGILVLDPMVDWISPAFGSFTAKEAKATLQVHPGDPVTLELRMDVAKLGAVTSAGEGRVEALHLEADAEFLNDTIGFMTRIKLGKVEGRAAGAGASMRDLTLALNVRDLARQGLSPDLDAPLSFDMNAQVATLGATDVGAKLDAKNIGLEVAGTYHAKGASEVTANLPYGAVKLRQAKQQPIVLPPGTVHLEVQDFLLNEEDVSRSQGKLKLAAQSPLATLDLSAEAKGGDANAFIDLRIAKLKRTLGSLGLHPLVPPELDIGRSALALRTHANWQSIDTPAPKMANRLEIDLSKITFQQPGNFLGFRRVGLWLMHTGNPSQHQAELRVDLPRPKLNGREMDGAVLLVSRGNVDLERQTAALNTTLSTPHGEALQSTLSAALSSQGTLQTHFRMALSGLGSLASAVPSAVRDAHPVDFAALSLEVDAEGSIGGFSARLVELGDGRKQGAPFRQNIALKLKDLHYAPEDMQLSLPALQVDVRASGDQQNTQLAADIHLPNLGFQDLGMHLVVHEAKTSLTAAAHGDPAEGRFEVAWDANIQQIQQDIVPAYPVADVLLTLRLKTDGLDTIELQQFVLANQRGGTSLEVSKEMSRVRAGQNAQERARSSGQRFALRGKLTQILDNLDKRPENLKARGQINVPFTVDSGDGTLFRIRAELAFDDVDIVMPEDQMSIEGLHANIMMEEAVEWTEEEGVQLVPYTERNPFTRTRFQDVQPFLNRNSFLKIRRVAWEGGEVGPIAGSMRVERNVFAIDKLKIEKEDARIAGQLTLDYLPGAEKLKFRGNVTGLRPQGSDDPLDFNMAIEFCPSRLELDGRIQLVRISKKHLLEALDLVDPYREDPAMNNLRRALGYGYPKRVAIGLSQGLMSMKVDFGGLGSLLEIGEIRGVPLGPFMNRHVAPFISW